MHELFDKLGYAAKRAAKNVANEVNVAAQKQQLSDCYRDLGKRYYQAIKAGQTPDLTDEIAKIDEALERIEMLKDRRDVTSVTNVTVEPIPAEEPKPDPTAEEPDFIIVEE